MVLPCMIDLCIPLCRTPIPSGILGQLSLKNYIYTTIGCHLVVACRAISLGKCVLHDFAILLGDIFVSWFKVIISVVRILQYCRFFLS